MRLEVRYIYDTQDRTFESAGLDGTEPVVDAVVTAVGLDGDHYTWIGDGSIWVVEAASTENVPFRYPPEWAGWLARIAMRAAEELRSLREGPGEAG
jgi:hypothetical protein